MDTSKIKFGVQKMDFSLCRLDQGEIRVATCLPPVSAIKSEWVNEWMNEQWDMEDLDHRPDPP